jgi:inward rectifier potassium channel
MNKLYTDLYHRLLRTSWPKLIGLLACAYLGANLIFGTAYFFLAANELDGLHRDTWIHEFDDCFFFSVQTMATIGYGRISPDGFIANCLVTFEALTGLFGLALTTGLVYSRFSRPTARVVFSRNVLIEMIDGVPSFVFRLANERESRIVDAQINVSMLKTEVTAEGETFYNFYTLELERSRSPFFSLTWTVVHPIEKGSPLFGMTREDLVRQEASFVVSLTGIDETFSQTVHSRWTYEVVDLRWDAKFVDILHWDKDGHASVDIARVHDVVI